MWIRPRGSLARRFLQCFSGIGVWDTLQPTVHPDNLLGIHTRIHITKLCWQGFEGNAIRQCTYPWDDQCYTTIYCLHCNTSMLFTYQDLLLVPTEVSSQGPLCTELLSHLLAYRHHNRLGTLLQQYYWNFWRSWRTDWSQWPSNLVEQVTRFYQPVDCPDSLIHTGRYSHSIPRRDDLHQKTVRSPKSRSAAQEGELHLLLPKPTMPSALLPLANSRFVGLWSPAPVLFYCFFCFWEIVTPLSNMYCPLE